MTCSRFLLLSTLTATFTAIACAAPGHHGQAAQNRMIDDAATAAEPRGQGRANTTLTAAERETLLHMRREEQLAHDIYVAMDARYHLTVFANITESETRHVEAIRSLLGRYGVPDPMAGRAVGTFDDPKMQKLYDSLLASGQASAVAALKVGAQIEELDIADLQAAIAATTRSDLKRVYGNLEDASWRHLRAFIQNLKARGETYEPTKLSQDAIDEKIASTDSNSPRTRRGQGARKGWGSDRGGCGPRGGHGGRR